MNDERIAQELLRLAGGRGNLDKSDMCFTRLRLWLVDPSAADVDGIEAIPEVVMTFTQSGQFQIVLGSRVRGVHAALTSLMDDRGTEGGNGGGGT